MKLSPVHTMFWTCVLVLCISRSETLHTDLCQDTSLSIQPCSKERYQRNDAGKMELVDDELDDYDDCFVDGGSCLLYPTSDLNCSWTSCPSSGNSSASVIICKEKGNVSSWNCLSEGDEAKTEVLCRGRVDSVSSVILRVNVSLPDMWTVYTCKHHVDDIEVLSPHPNISVLFREGSLLVRWGVPYSRTTDTPSCFDFQLDINNRTKDLYRMKKLEHVEPNADPTLTYKVRIRTQKNKSCGHSQHWSEWSDTVVLAPTKSLNKLSSLVIGSIMLGIPMILLTLLLLFRSQRPKLLFQPVPRPPLQYQQFLEKHDAFQSFPPVPPPTYTEEFLEVEDAEEALVKTQAPNS